MLADEVGYPYTHYNTNMFHSFSGGYASEASLCGALGVAATFIGAVLEPEEARPVIKEMMDWYKAADLPVYNGGDRNDVTTVADSTLCYQSVGRYIKAADTTYSAEDRRERCASVTADVAKYTVEILNAKLG